MNATRVELSITGDGHVLGDGYVTAYCYINNELVAHYHGSEVGIVAALHAWRDHSIVLHRTAWHLQPVLEAAGYKVTRTVE